MANISPAVSASTWGLITGTLTNQTDLTAYLSANYFPLSSFTSSFNSAFALKSTTDLSEGTNLYFTNERVDDRVAALIVAGSNITSTYDDASNTLTIASTASALDLVSYTYAGGF